MAESLCNNINPMGQLNFKLEFPRLPSMTKMTTGISIPGLTFGQAQHDTMFIGVGVPGTNLQYETFNVDFIVNENMQSYLEVYIWLMKLGYPKSFKQFCSLKEDSIIGNTYDGQYADCTVHILNNNKNTQGIEYRMRDCFPIGLTQMTFDSQADKREPIKVTATFQFQAVDMITPFYCDDVNSL